MTSPAQTHTPGEKREQVARQYEVIEHMASVLISIGRCNAGLLREGKLDELIEMLGESTARQMEFLGDILNGMDAVDESDARFDPVFEEAQRLWPPTPKGTQP